MTFGTMKEHLSHLLGDPVTAGNDGSRYTDLVLTSLLNLGANGVLTRAPLYLLWTLTKKGTGTTDASGQVAYPTDIAHLLKVIWDGKPARPYQVASLTNAFVGGTATEPVWYFSEGKLQFEPTTTSKAVVVHYLHSAISLAYTANSTEHPLPPNLHIAVIHFAAYLGRMATDEIGQAQLEILEVDKLIGKAAQEYGNNGTASN